MEISYTELPSEYQSKYVIKPRREAVTWTFLFCWHPLTSSNPYDFRHLYLQPCLLSLQRQFSLSQPSQQDSDVILLVIQEKKKKTIQRKKQYKDKVSQVTSRKQSEIALLTSPSHEGLVAPRNTGLSPALMHIVRSPITQAFWLAQKAKTTCAGNPLSYECCVTLGLQRETPSKSEKYYWHWYLKHWYAVTSI